MVLVLEIAEIVGASCGLEDHPVEVDQGNDGARYSEEKPDASQSPILMENCSSLSKPTRHLDMLYWYRNQRSGPDIPPV